MSAIAAKRLHVYLPDALRGICRTPTVLCTVQEDREEEGKKISRDGVETPGSGHCQGLPGWGREGSGDGREPEAEQARRCKSVWFVGGDLSACHRRAEHRVRMLGATSNGRRLGRLDHPRCCSINILL